MSVKIDQAFLAAYIAGDFGLEVAHENLAFIPTAGISYAELINLPNDITAFSLNDSNETDGLFRIILYWPLGKGAIQAKLKADEILSAFSIGSKVCYESQCATVTKTYRAKGVAEDGWYKTIISIGYYANIKR